ncbi:unnamed protein product [Adineta ricciae]|uniref:CCHC-type domain-containing protein n=1 Tax=Adineta ricciae TaxID=249248 RepID=A0A815Z6Q4_ADIRI|nr:unnamed protein product [Adineta ricciae]
MSSYNKYATMTKEMKDKLVEGEDFVRSVKAYNLRSNQQANDRTPKRNYPGDQGLTDYDEPTLINDDIPKQKKKIMRRINDDNKSENNILPPKNNDQSSTHDDQEWRPVNNTKNKRTTNTSRTFINGNLSGMNHQMNHRNSSSSHHQKNYHHLNDTNNNKNNDNNSNSNSNLNKNHDHTLSYNTPTTEDSNQYQIESSTTNHGTSQSEQQNIRVSEHALRYAIEQHLPPLKIVCEPKLTESNEAKNLLKELFSSINKKFIEINPKYTKPLAFDYWFIDRDGNLSCFTNSIELFVFLSNGANYPNHLSNINIRTIPPKRLPPQCSVIFKFVPNDITTEELEEEIKTKYQSAFTIVEMRGSRTSRNRHIRLDLMDHNEYMRILNSGVFAIAGQLIETSEFLAPPRLLICSKCNTPGHIKKNCKINCDTCRRCGGDGAQGDHVTCNIQCHHCKGEHEATSFKCPLINEFRCQLIEQLKKRPDLLPYNVQLFIPTELRNRNEKNSRILTNNAANSQSQRSHPSKQTYSYHDNNWPQLPGDMRNTTVSQMKWTPLPTDSNTLWNEMMKTQYEFDMIKQKYEQQELNLSLKLNEQKMKLESILSLLSVQVQQQHESLNSLFTIIKEVVPMVSNSLAICQELATKGRVQIRVYSVVQIEKFHDL